MMQQIPEFEITAVPSPVPPNLMVLDVREDDEWRAGHIDGALHIPLMELPQRLADIPNEHQILVVCKVGGRSAQATQFLQARGRDAANLSGGMVAWQGAGRDMVADDNSEPFVA